MKDLTKQRPSGVVSLSLSVALVFVAACGRGEYLEPPPPEVDVAKPEPREVVDYLEMTGTTESVQTVELRARVAGFLQSIEFAEGDYVNEGDLLYVIDPAEYQSRVERSEASRDVAFATLELREATLARFRQARKSGAVSELDVIEAQAEREVAAADLNSVEAELRNAELDLSYTRILAPNDGRIGRSLVDPGNLVGAAEKTLLTVIVQYDPINAYFAINERAVLAITESEEGSSRNEAKEDAVDRWARVKVELGRANDDGYPYVGRLDYADVGVDPETGTYLLRAIYENTYPHDLLPGLFVRGRIAIDRRDGILHVPERALGADQGGRYVLVVDDDDVAQFRRVEVGILHEGMRAIESGLEPDDRVVVNGLMRARPGSKVTPVTPGAPDKPDTPVASEGGGS
jgi:RND family efflux transporter MFP subunit